MSLSLFAFLSLLVAANAFANEDTVYLDQMLKTENAKVANDPARTLLDPEDIYRRTKLVMEHFAVPAEPDYQKELNGFRFTATIEQIASAMKFFDPYQQFARFFSQAGTVLQSFSDRDAKRVEEYRFGLETPPVEAPPSETPPPEEGKSIRSLEGLRVALDPGHMGGDLWDGRTGKFVRNSAGVKVSEGMINLQTSLLVEQKLRALGAEVLVTHRGLGPVSTVPYERLDLQAFGRAELRAVSLEDWFQSLLASTDEDNLGRKFQSSSTVQKLFSERARGDYFTHREDLQARAKMIAAFKPDITLVVHFDSDSTSPTPRMPNITRAYVPGSFGKTEFASGEARARFIGHLGQGEQWAKSVRLSKAVVNEISESLGVPMPKTDTSGSTPVLQGVFARNLALTRQVIGSPISYLECLSYGNEAEFYRLAKNDGGTLQIDGRAVPYSKRLDQLATAIATGVQKYLAESK